MDTKVTTTEIPASVDTVNRALLALTIIFGVSTLALVIVLILCLRRARRNIQRSAVNVGGTSGNQISVSNYSNTAYEQDLEQGVTHTQQEQVPNDDIPAAGDPVEAPDEEADVLGALPVILPSYFASCKKKTFEVFGASSGSVHDPHESVIVPQRISQIGILMATQDCYQSFASPTSPVMVGSRRTILESADLERSIEAQIIDQIEVTPVPRTIGHAPPARTHGAGERETVDRQPRQSVFQAAQQRGETIGPSPEVDVSHGMFVSKSVNPSEQTSLELYGVRLDLPAGAVTSTTVVSLGIMWSRDHYPKLSRTQALLSPVISCEPHGLELQKSAYLTLPHCALDAQRDWSLRVQHSATAATSKSQWKDNNSANWQLKGSKIKLEKKHFCLDCVVGEPVSATTVAKKRVVLMACAPPLTGTTFKIRVFCFDDYDDEGNEGKGAKKAQKDMERFKRKPLDDTTLSFYCDNQDLRTKLNVDEESKASWKLTSPCPDTKDMDYEDILHSKCPNVDYQLSCATTKKTSRILCHINGHQITHSDKQQTIYIGEDPVSQTEPGRIDVSVLDPVFPSTIRQEIIELLDPDYLVNWQHVAEKMGKNVKDVTYLQHTGRYSSPTLSLLQEWAEGGKTLLQFKNLVLDLPRPGRPDVHEVIEKYLNSQNTTRH